MSSHAIVASRYASALFALQQDGENFQDSLSVAVQVLNDEAAAAVLLSPSCPDQAAAEVFGKVLSGRKGADLMLRLVGLLSTRQKLCLLPEIADQFHALLARSSGNIDVDVTVAVKPLKKTATLIERSLTGSTGKNVRVRLQQDTNILGGLIVELGDRKIDYSLKSKLEGLRQALTS